MKYRLRIDLTFDASDDVEARETVVDWLLTRRLNLEASEEYCTAHLHNLTSRHEGHRSVSGPWESRCLN